MVTEEDILDAGFMPYEYVWVAQKINRETGKHDRMRINRHDVYVLPGINLNSNLSLPHTPYIFKDVKDKYKQVDGMPVIDGQTVTFFGKHGALNFPVKNHEQLIKFKSYVNQNSRKNNPETDE
jgi:hypothetical protein